MTKPKIGDWVTVTRGDPDNPGMGPKTGQLVDLGPGGPRMSWPADPRGVGHWWVTHVRPATPEEIAAHQLASGMGASL